MPRIEKCDCGKDFDLDYSKPCSQCKSNYCEDCCKNGKKCVYCKSPTNKTDKLIETLLQTLKIDKYPDSLIERIRIGFELTEKFAREEERGRILALLKTFIGAAHMGVTKEVLIDLHNYLSNQQQS